MHQWACIFKSPLHECHFQFLSHCCRSFLLYGLHASERLEWCNRNRNWRSHNESYNLQGSTWGKDAVLWLRRENSDPLTLPPFLLQDPAKSFFLGCVIPSVHHGESHNLEKTFLPCPVSVRLVGRIQGHKTKLSMPRPSYVLHFHLSQSGSYMGGVPNFSRLWYICIYPFSILFTKWLQPICKTQKHAISALDCPNLLRMCGDQEISGCQSQDGVQIL